jgi:branched-chain amino acid transport system ATP-binding protein
MEDPILECSGMTTGYAGTAVVHDLDLSVREGEVVALLGPNGAGKTTTLLALSGVIRTMSGSVRACGAPVKGGRSHLAARRGVSFVPDDRSLFFNLTARQNLRLATSRNDSGSSLKQALEYFPALEPILDRRAGLMSGGEQQMLALGRALAMRPKVLMVDEMSLGLAPIIVQQLMPTVRRIARDLGTGILLVEQHVDLALKAADRAYVLDRGRVSLTGGAAELAESRELLLASYMGEMAYENAAETSTEHGTATTVNGAPARNGRPTPTPEV